MRSPWRAAARFACAAATPGDAAGTARAIAAARRARVPRRALEETGLMLVLYGGFPAAIEALWALDEAWPGGRPRRVESGNTAAFRRRGAALCRRVYGPVYPQLLARVRALHPDLATWMEETGYGRVLSRPGLDARARELVTVAVLAALGWSRQLRSHKIGAVRVGATAREVGEAETLGVAARSARDVDRRERERSGPRSRRSEGGKRRRPEGA